MKHTEGEWKVIKHPVFYGKDVVAVDSDGKHILICEMTAIRGDSFIDNAKDIKANAKLISAAPDLLKACQKAMQIVDLWGAGLYAVIPEEHEQEIKALAAMEDEMRLAIQKAK